MDTYTLIGLILAALLVVDLIRAFTKRRFVNGSILLSAIGISDKDKTMNLQVTLNDDDQVSGTFQVVDKKHQPDLNAVLSWEVDDATIATVTTDTPDGKTVTLVAQKPGQTAAHATVQGGTLKLDVAITVLASADTEITGVFGTPTTQPEATAPAAG